MYAEKQNPGFMHDFVAGVIQNEDMTEILLRLGSTECTEYLISSNIELYAQLNMKAQFLRVLLNSIPDQIRAKSICSQTLNDIAESMKDLLLCVNHFYKSNRNHPAVTQNKTFYYKPKNEFVRCSRAFRDSLGRFFKDDEPSIVFLSANNLITQTNVLMRTIKIITEKG